MDFKTRCENLEAEISNIYTKGIGIDDAEKLAAEFLSAQFQVSKELKNADLDARMRKSGLKALRASVYMEAATKGDKKPSDTLLENLVTSHELVQKEQEAYDKAEVDSADLQRYYEIFREAHIFLRGVSRGRFE
jgi:hypothetical protein